MTGAPRESVFKHEGTLTFRNARLVGSNRAFPGQTRIIGVEVFINVVFCKLFWFLLFFSIFREVLPFLGLRSISLLMADY